MGRDSSLMGASRQRGVTLVELLIAVVIIGILASLAVPSYLDHIRRSRRADAQMSLLQIAQTLERCRTQYGSYEGGQCNWNGVNLAADESVESIDGNYAIAVDVAAAEFSLTAKPQGGQAADKACSSFSLNHRGTRAASDASCW